MDGASWFLSTGVGSRFFSWVRILGRDWGITHSPCSFLCFDVPAGNGLLGGTFKRGWWVHIHTADRIKKTASVAAIKLHALKDPIAAAWDSWSRMQFRAPEVEARRVGYAFLSPGAPASLKNVQHGYWANEQGLQLFGWLNINSAISGYKT